MLNGVMLSLIVKIGRVRSLSRGSSSYVISLHCSCWQDFMDIAYVLGYEFSENCIFNTKRMLTMFVKADSKK